jgi:signal transduction histidine kinase/CheY-like chemotaxis protein
MISRKLTHLIWQPFSLPSKGRVGEGLNATLLIILLLFSLPKTSISQDQHKVDSLRHLMKTTRETTIKIDALNSLAYEFRRYNNDTVLFYANKALAIAKTTGYKMGTADANMNISRALLKTGIYEKALKASTEAIKIYDQLLVLESPAGKTNILIKKSDGYINLGTICYYQGNNAEALKYYLESLKIREEIGDQPKIITSLNNIGMVFMALHNHPEALKNYVSALKIEEQIGDTMHMDITYNNIGLIYMEQGNNAEALKNFFAAIKLEDKTGNKMQKVAALINIGCIYLVQGKNAEALKKIIEALKLAEEVGDKRGQGHCFNTIANVYADQGDYSEAVKYRLSALKIAKEIGDKFNIVSAYTGIGTDYLRMKKHAEASAYLNKGLSLAKETGNLKFIVECYLSISRLDSTRGDFNSSLKNYKMYITFKDSLLNSENADKTTGIQMQYEFDKKESLNKAEQEKKDAVAQKEIQKQKLVRNGFIGGFVVVLLFAGVFFRQRNKIKKGNAALQVAKDRAERSEQFKQQFLANMSHEIRTPMNAVMGMTSLVLDTPLQEKQKFYLEGIKKSSDTLLHIINDILDLSKIEAGKMELEKIDFSLSDTLKQVKQTLNHRAEEKGLELLVNIESEITDVVIGDPVRLNQVLINLAGNAIKFTEKGSVSIEVTKGGAESALQFSVIDTGIGIPQEKLQTVFENFSQANASDTRKYGGTGLGLSISRQLVELMGGKISIASTEGSGTTFSFIVHCEKGSSERLEQRLASEEQVDGHILDGLSILVVDDNEYNRIVAKDTLEAKSRAEVVAVGSAMEALELLKAKNFDVVLMDVQMPVMNGFEATQQIRSTKYEVRSTNRGEVEPKADIPIIALTASVLRTDLDKCTAAGMNGYIPKPFRASQLIIGIAQVLNIALRTEKKVETKGVPSLIPSSGVTDLDYLTKFCEGDQVRMKKYVEMFLASVPSLLEKIKVATENSDHVEIASQLHGFKTKLLMMGMKEAKELAAEIEIRCRQGDSMDSVTLMLQKIVQQVEAATKELKTI